MTDSKIKIVAIIPARMGSSRFPGKPLANILGLPMIEHVRRRVEMCKILDSTYVATCDEEIVKTVENYGGKAVMTSSSHERASDRVAEASMNIESDIFVLVQGDEPMILPEMIDLAVKPMIKDHSIGCVNLTRRIDTNESWHDPNTIKVVTGINGNALYFSREPIPTSRILGIDNIPKYKQVCIIPFRKDALLKYASLEPSPLEESESVDMMRFLENEYPVRMVETEFDTYSVDTPEDLERIEQIMRGDQFTKNYLTHPA